MIDSAKLFECKDNAKFVEENAVLFLLTQIYSPTVIRTLKGTWDGFPACLQNIATPEVQTLIQQADTKTDNDIQKTLDQMMVDKAINVLQGYDKCLFPLTKDPTIPAQCMSFVSDKGRKILKILQNARTNQRYSSEIIDFSLKAGHPLFLDLSLYKTPQLSKKFIMNCLITQQEEGKKDKYIYPLLQLTKGCIHHCSHCCVDAKPHLSHMPYPVFASLYQQLNEIYKNCPQTEKAGRFARFFDDSDMLAYWDHVIGADSGDVIMHMQMKNPNQFIEFTTRGVTKNLVYQNAFTKAFLTLPFKSDKKRGNNPLSILVSVVDTQEDRQRSLELLNETLDRACDLEPFYKQLLQQSGVKEKKAMELSQLCLFFIHRRYEKTATISEELFRGCLREEDTILAAGRAATNKKAEKHPDSCYLPRIVIRPNGYVVSCTTDDGMDREEVIGNIFEGDKEPPRTTLYFTPKRSSLLQTLRNLPSFMWYELSGKGREINKYDRQITQDVRRMVAKTELRGFITQEQAKQLKRRCQVYDYEHSRVIVSLWFLAIIQECRKRIKDDYRNFEYRKLCVQARKQQ